MAFFVPDAPEFERGMELERSRLHRRAFEAAWQVTETEERNGNSFGAAYWARRAAALAPADEAAIRRLMTLLDRLGDRAGAVQAYEDFARRMKADLDIEPSAETQAVVRSIRSASAPADSTPAAVEPGPTASELPAPVIVEPAVPLPRQRRKWAPVAIALALLAGGAASLSFWSRAGAPSNVSADLVAVFPFAARGDPSIEYLEEGLSSLLSTGLDGAGDLRSVDPHVVLSAVTREQAGPPDPRSAGRLAASLGAGWYVLGDVVGTGPQIRIDATLYDARQGNRGVGVASAQGPIDSLFGLVDRVTGQLIASQRGDSARAVSRLAAVTTHSIPALKAYLEGERQFRRGSFPRAIAGYQRAISLDSTFALAYYRLAGAYAWSGSDSSVHAAALAVRFGRRLAGSERELLRALLAYEEGQVDEAERQYREILRRRPQELDALFQLGEVLFHHNVSRGRDMGESRPFFQRAREWNHSDAPLIHLVELAALERDFGTFDSLMSGIQPESHFWLTG
ncbi:MAG: BTAD domain-containing putative transcriptional regulator, partial [Gemmatimonadales bacterium]